VAEVHGVFPEHPLLPHRTTWCGVRLSTDDAPPGPEIPVTCTKCLRVLRENVEAIAKSWRKPHR